ncbi:MAG: hypothetical protein WC414_04110 [Patescibacteria group bacterium]
MKKNHFIVAVVSCFLIAMLFLISLEFYKGLKIKNANYCYSSKAREYIILKCYNKPGEEGNRCRDDFYYNTMCGKAIEKVYKIY